jgi:hypothetical protein
VYTAGFEDFPDIGFGSSTRFGVYWKNTKATYLTDTSLLFNSSEALSIFLAAQ